MFREMIDRLERSEDLSHGQVVIITARWILVVAALMLALWDPEGIGDLRVQIVLVLGLAVANFYLHSQILMGRPVVPLVAFAASAADITVISLIIIAQGGFESNLFVFFFPAILAFSVAFGTWATLAFAGAAVSAYGIIAAATFAGDDAQVIITRLLMLAGVAVCGSVYWRIERDRRRAIVEPLEDANTQVRQEVPVA